MRLVQIKAREIISIGARVVYSISFLFYFFFVSLKRLLYTNRVDIAPGLTDRSCAPSFYFYFFFVQNFVPLENALSIRVALLALFVVWGIKNSESCPVLFGGSEILTLLLCCLGVRNSESSPVLFGGSEILTPLLCCLGGQKF